MQFYSRPLPASSRVLFPVQDSPRQRLLDGKGLPEKFWKDLKPANSYKPGFRDPYDSAHDSVGKKLDPLPYRNGLGASVLGHLEPGPRTLERRSHPAAKY